MKFQWIGKYDGTNLPTVSVKDKEKVLPPTSLKHVLVLIAILLLFGLLAYVKNRIFKEPILFSRMILNLGFLIGILLFPVHELLHAISFPTNGEVFFYYTNGGLGITCTSPMSRNRFIFVNLLPALILGMISLILYLVLPAKYTTLATLSFAVAFLHIAGSFVDFVNVAHVLRLPTDAVIQISGKKIYWRGKDE